WSVLSLPVRVTFSDAPNSACGAFVKDSNLVFYQNWSPVVIWYSDNQNVESILQNGCRVADMHQLALLVIQICLEFHISLEVTWIPWERNAKADAISNLTDYDDYTINTTVLSSKANGTVMVYNRAFRGWNQFANDKLKGKAFPASPFHVALYLQHLLEETHSPSVY
ncbi:unnamed protein product, partial [Pocillopora meandrina]